jgi:predicted regulator of Ras-like GTPase activity (Roadblock/LC7/MglB family)
MPDLVLFEADGARLAAILDRLRQDANAKLTFLLDKNGQQLASAGDLGGIDPTSLASLTAGNVAATDGLAKLIGEREFSILFHEGERDHLHISVVAGCVILVVLFDLRSSLGLVRLRVKQASADLTRAIGDILARSEAQRGRAIGAASPFAEITDADIDALFG